MTTLKLEPKHRCPDLDEDGCRCLLRAGHRSAHDYSYTPWGSVLNVRTKPPRVWPTWFPPERGEA